MFVSIIISDSSRSLCYFYLLTFTAFQSVSDEAFREYNSIIIVWCYATIEWQTKYEQSPSV